MTRSPPQPLQDPCQPDRRAAAVTMEPDMPDAATALPAPGLLDTALRWTCAVVVGGFCLLLHYATDQPPRLGLGGR